MRITSLRQLARTGRRTTLTATPVRPLGADLCVPTPRRDPVRRTLRIGTGYAGTARHLLLPAVQRLRAGRPGVKVTITSLTPEEIRDGLLDGSLDLAVHARPDDEATLPAGLDATVLLRGELVAALSTGHALAGLDRVSAADLRAVPFVGMPAEHLVDQLAHAFFGDRVPVDWHVADNAETAKLMVAEALGVSLLPDYCITGDPLERAGLVTTRPLAGDRTEVVLQLLRHERSRDDAVVTELATALTRRAAATTIPSYAGA